MSRRLVVTADDLGVENGTADAVADLVVAGRLSAASVIPMAPWATRAVEVLARHAVGAERSLSLGLHATFTAGENGRAWGPLTDGTTLVRAGYSGFHEDVGTFAAAAEPTEVLDELEAQVRWFIPVGVRPTHLDSHHGALYGFDGPHFLNATVRVCARHGLALRLPRVFPEELGALGQGVRTMHRESVTLADDLGVTLPETVGTDWRPLSQLTGYRDLRDAYLRLVRSLPEGLSEIFLHPAAEPATADTRTGNEKRFWEHRLLEDDVWGEVLAEEGVSVVPWPLPAHGP